MSDESKQKVRVVRVSHERLLELSEQFKREASERSSALAPGNEKREQRGVLRLPVSSPLRMTDGTRRKPESSTFPLPQDRKALLELIHGLDQCLSGLVSRRRGGGEEEVMKVRERLVDSYRQLAISFPAVAYSNDIVDLMWKSAFYKMIEWMKDRWSKVEISNFIQSSIKFYQEQLDVVRDGASLQFDACFRSPLLYVPPSGRKERLAHLHCHKILIYIGDLYRYNVTYTPSLSNDYGLARKFYLQAQSLVPKNGKSYNQLAVIAALTKRKLDSTFYYVRSLAVSKPYVNAREKLMALFEGVKRREKYMMEQELQKGTVQQRKEKKVPKEIWLFDGLCVDEDGVAIGHDPDPGPCSSSVLGESVSFKGTVTRFLALQGALFSRIGLDRFPALLDHFLKDFLATGGGAEFDHMTLVKMTAVIIFSVWNSRQASVVAVAVQMALEFFGCLCKIAATNADQTHSRLYDVLPSLRLLSEWMMFDNGWWRKSACCISALRSFCSVLNVVGVADSPAEVDSPASLALSEDMLLAGFVPLQRSHGKKKQEPSIGAEVNTVRIQCLRSFADFLAALPTPLLVCSDKYNVIESVDDKRMDVPPLDTPSEAAAASNANSESESDEIEIVGEEFPSDDTDVGDDGDDVDSSSVGQLIAKKKALAAQVAEEQKRDEGIRGIFAKQEKTSLKPVQIRPKYLVPDTNCFVENLQLLQQISKARAFTTAVPLVVVNELSGLSKGVEAGGGCHNQQVEKAAQAAVAASQYIEQCFKLSHNVSLLTSNGNLLGSLAFRNQDTSSIKGNNDDVILESCKKLNKALALQGSGADTKIQEVVLITDDRNLRVKAHTCGIVVTNIRKFFQLANINT